MLSFMALYSSPHIRFVSGWRESDWQYLLAPRCQDAGLAKAHITEKPGAVARMGLADLFLNVVLCSVLSNGKEGSFWFVWNSGSVLGMKDRQDTG